MKDKDIIKALECISGQASPDFDCGDCRIERSKYTTCEVFVTEHALDLIKNQQAEIERLRDAFESMGVDTKKQIDMFESYEKQIEELKFQVDARDSHILKLKQENDDLRERLEHYRFFKNKDVDRSDLLM